MNVLKDLQVEEDAMNSSSEEICLETKIDIAKKDIQLMSEFGLSELIPGFVQELTAYQRQYFTLTGRPYQRPSRSRTPGGNICRTGVGFWVNICDVLSPQNLAMGDRVILTELCSSKGWIDAIPSGLLMSYTYLYQCVRGIGSEDAPIIERDVLRTVGAVKAGAKVFHDTSEMGKAGLARAMHRVLTAISVTDGMGYCQGMNYVVDFLLKVVSEDDAFCLFVYALRCQHLCTLYETKLPVLSDLMETFELQLSFHRPALAANLKEKGFLAPFYSIEWFTTLFTLSCPPSLTFLIWDMFFFGFKDTLLRCALALMIVLEEELILMNTESLLKEFRKVCMTVDPAAVIVEAFKVQLAPMKYHTGDRSASYLERTALSSTCHSPFTGTSGGSVRRSSKFLSAYDDGTRGERLLLALRCKYLPEAQTAIQERDAEAERWGQFNRSNPKLSEDIEVAEADESNREAALHEMSVELNEIPCLLKKYGLIDDNIFRNDRLHDAEDSQLNEIEDDDKYLQSDDFVRSNSPASAIFIEDVESDVESQNRQDRAKSFVESAQKRKSFTELSNEYLSDSKVYEKIAELRDIITKCSRLSHWLDLNRGWFECLLLLRSDLQRYNIADHLLRFSISCGGHIRVIGFFLAIAGADPNAQDRWLCTPLHIAGKYNRPDAARLLLLSGADKTITGALLWSARQSASAGSVPYIGLTAEELVASMGTAGSHSYSSQPLLSQSVLNILKGRVCSMCNCVIAQLGGAVDGPHGVSKTCNFCDIVMCGRCVARDTHWCVRAAFAERRQLASGLRGEQMFPVVNTPHFSSGDKPLPNNQAAVNAKDCAGQRSCNNRGHESMDKQVYSTEMANFNISEPRSSLSETSTDSGFMDGQTEPCCDTSPVDEKCDETNNRSKLLSRFRSFSFSTDLGSQNESGGRVKIGKNCSAQYKSGGVSDLLEKQESATSSRDQILEKGNLVLKKETASKRSSFKALFTRRRDSSVKRRAENDHGAINDNKKNLRNNASWLHRVGIKRRSSFARGSSDDITVRAHEEGGVPAYWVGYRGLDEWPLQSWQLYLLPLIVGSDPIPLASGDDYKDRADLEMDLFQRSKVLPAPFSPGDPELLCFRNEIGRFYELMNRDSRIVLLQSDSFVAHGQPITKGISTPRCCYLIDESLQQSNVLKGGLIVSVKSGILSTHDQREEISTLVEINDPIRGTSNSVESSADDEGNVKQRPKNLQIKSQQRYLQRNELGRFFLSGKWILSDGDPLWTPDDSVWHCSTCFLVFTMFQRKHHCRRCGGLFCNDHAPLVDLLPHCTPDYLIPQLKQQILFENIDVKPVRLCSQCRYEMKHSPELQQELKACQKKFSLSFWQTMTVMNRPLNSIIHNDDNNSIQPSTNDIKGVTFAKFPNAGHWTDSMTGLLWGKGKRHAKS